MSQKRKLPYIIGLQQPYVPTRSWLRTLLCNSETKRKRTKKVKEFKKQKQWSKFRNPERIWRTRMLEGRSKVMTWPWNSSPKVVLMEKKDPTEKSSPLPLPSSAIFSFFLAKTSNCCFLLMKELGNPWILWSPYKLGLFFHNTFYFKIINIK